MVRVFNLPVMKYSSEIALKFILEGLSIQTGFSDDGTLIFFITYIFLMDTHER